MVHQKNSAEFVKTGATGSLSLLEIAAKLAIPAKSVDNAIQRVVENYNHAAQYAPVA